MSYDQNYTKKAELLARDIYDWCKANVSFGVAEYYYDYSF